MDMKVEDLYKEMIRGVIFPPLKKLGYTKVKTSFYFRFEGNLGIINFQKSQKSDSSQIVFTVNMGIASKRILNFLSFPEEKQRPLIWDTQLRVRLGHLLWEGHDVWWTINQETTIDTLGPLFLDYVVNYCVPFIQDYITDEALRDLWMTGKSPSLTEFERLLYLSVLLKQTGPIEILETTLNELRQLTFNKPSAIRAEIFINKVKGL
jgi:hypothetical protein